MLEHVWGFGWVTCSRASPSLQFLERLRHLQGLQVATGFFQFLSIVASFQPFKNFDIYEASKLPPASSSPWAVGLLQLYRLLTKVSSLSSIGTIVETLPLWLFPVPVLLRELAPCPANPIKPDCFEVSCVVWTHIIVLKNPLITEKFLCWPRAKAGAGAALRPLQPPLVPLRVLLCVPLRVPLRVLLRDPLGCPHRLWDPKALVAFLRFLVPVSDTKGLCRFSPSS